MGVAPTRQEMEQYENALRARLERVAGDLESLEADARGVPDIPEDEQATSGSTLRARNEDVEFLEVEDQAFRDVLDAIARLERGTYGRCENCGDWISRERLQAVPEARYCVACQAEING